MALLALIGGVVALRQGISPKPQVQAPRGAVAPQRAALAQNPEGWLGVLISEESMDVAPRWDGRVESVAVQVGSEVRQGEVLVKLDAKSFQEDLAIAEATLHSSQAELQLAQLAVDQAQERLQRRDSPEQVRLQAISEEELSAVRYEHRMASAKLEVAKARVREQEVRVEQLRQSVADASLRSPFDGVVSGRFVHPMALVKAGQPVIHVLRRGKPQVRFALPSQQTAAVVVGQPVRIEVAERSLTLEGRVTQVAPEVDVATLMVFALAELPQDTQVPAGTAVRVKAPVMPAQAENP